MNYSCRSGNTLHRLLRQATLVFRPIHALVKRNRDGNGQCRVDSRLAEAQRAASIA